MYKGYIRRICVTLHISIIRGIKLLTQDLRYLPMKSTSLALFFVLALGPKITTMCFVDTRRIL
jgi:hypothetical protein